MSEELKQPCPQCGGIHEPGNCEKGLQQEPVEQYGGTPEDPLNIADFTREELLVGFGLSSMISNHEFDRVKAVMERYNLHDSVVQEQVKDALWRVVRNGAFNLAMEVIAEFDLPESIVREVIKGALLVEIKKFSVEEIEKILAKFAMAEEILLSSDVKEDVKTALILKLQVLRAGSGASEIERFVGLLDPQGDIISLPEVRKVAIERADFLVFSDLRLDTAATLIGVFKLSEDDLRYCHIKKLTGLLVGSGGSRSEEYISFFSLSDSIIQSPEVQSTAACSLRNSICVRETRMADSIIKNFKLPLSVIQDAVFAGFQDIIAKSLAGAVEIREKYADYLPESILLPVVQKEFLRCLESGDMRSVSFLKESFASLDSFVKSEEVLALAWETIRNLIIVNGIDFEWVHTAKKLFGFTDDGIFASLKGERPFSTIVEKFKTKDLRGLDGFIRKHKDFVFWIVKNRKDWILEMEDFEIKNFGVRELHVLKESGLDLSKMSNEMDKKDEEKYSQQMFLAFKNEKSLEWKDQENISRPFENGAKEFGYKKMFQYIGREGLSRHDALHNFNKILELLAASGLRPEQFYGQILDQVRMDDGHYETGTAHHELNSLANNINLNIQETVAKAQKYADIEKMQVLVQDLGAPEQVFASWKNLKKYGELCNLLGRTEILDQLQELKKSGKMKLYKFVETLAFHPNINMKAVFQFWRDPEQFLDLKDNHDAAKVHDRKKPSNYTHIPNLDLTAVDLRDAQVEGDLDKLQAFRPMEIVYELPQSGEVISERETDLLVLMKEALGSYKDKKEGKAKDPKKLFKQLQNLFKEAGLKFQDYLACKLQVDAKLEGQARELIQNEKIGYVKKPAGETYRYRAKINLKSDPDGVVAGNDTACCMPFGSGKNNIYTFNPVCSLFTIQQERADGAWRTVAQSVLTKDKDIKKSIAEVLKQMNDPEKPPIGSVLSEDVLNQSESVLACDNVELTPNVKGHKLTEAQVELIYRDFMAEYLARYAKQDNLSTDQVVIGQGYSDSLTHLPQVPNTYAPSAPVGYSDKTHEKVYQLIPKLAEGIKKQVIENSLPGGKKVELITGQKGVSYLTFEDTLPVAFIEGKAYHDNQTLIQYLHNMENALIAKDINNTAKGRPNMSLKHIGEDGKIHGYMLAYEGRMSEDEGKEGEEGKPIIYVSDIASDLKHPGTGGALMRAFLEQYRQNYVSKGKFVPIYAQAREKTSYAIIKSKLKKYGEEVGLELEMEELGAYQEGDDTMHQIIIRVKV